MPSPRPLVRFDDIPAGTALQFSHFREEITARTPKQVRAALRAVQDRVDGGAWAAGMITYEAAPGLDPALSTHCPGDLLPLLWFGIADAPDVSEAPAASPSQEHGEYEVGTWQDEWSPAEHAEKVARVHAAIAEGDTYQVNLTTRRRAGSPGICSPAIWISSGHRAPRTAPTWTSAAPRSSARARSCSYGVRGSGSPRHR